MMVKAMKFLRDLMRFYIRNKNMGVLARTMAFMIEDPDNAGQFKGVCGFRSKTFERSAEMKDTTIPDCNNPGDPLNKSVRPGAKEYSFEGDGLFQSEKEYKLCNAAFEAQTAIEGKIVVPTLGTYTCAAGWHIPKLSLSGEMDDDLAMSIGFAPAGKVVFVEE